MRLMKFAKAAWWVIMVLGGLNIAFSIFLLFVVRQNEIPIAIAGIASGLLLMAMTSTIILALRCAEKYLAQ
jgi:hypothetical protein